MKKIISLIGIYMLILISGCGIQEHTHQSNDKGKYDFCDEWNGGEATLYDMFHFVNTKYMSNNSTIFVWLSIDADTGDMRFYERDENDTITTVEDFNCTRYVKSLTLEKHMFVDFK